MTTKLWREPHFSHRGVVVSKSEKPVKRPVLFGPILRGCLWRSSFESIYSTCMYVCSMYLHLSAKSLETLVRFSCIFEPPDYVSQCGQACRFFESQDLLFSESRKKN